MAKRNVHDDSKADRYKKAAEKAKADAAAKKNTKTPATPAFTMPTLDEISKQARSVYEPAYNAAVLAQQNAYAAKKTATDAAWNSYNATIATRKAESETELTNSAIKRGVARGSDLTAQIADAYATIDTEVQQNSDQYNAELVNLASENAGVIGGLSGDLETNVMNQIYTMQGQYNAQKLEYEKLKQDQEQFDRQMALNEYIAKKNSSGGGGGGRSGGGGETLAQKLARQAREAAAAAEAAKNAPKNNDWMTKYKPTKKSSGVGSGSFGGVY